MKTAALTPRVVGLFECPGWWKAAGHYRQIGRRKWHGYGTDIIDGFRFVLGFGTVSTA
jgi:hypothetical protein